MSRPVRFASVCDGPLCLRLRGQRVDGAAVDRLGGDVGLGGGQLLVLHAAAHLDALEHVGDHLGAPRRCLIII